MSSTSRLPGWWLLLLMGVFAASPVVARAQESEGPEGPADEGATPAAEHPAAEHPTAEHPTAPEEPAPTTPVPAGTVSLAQGMDLTLSGSIRVRGESWRNQGDPSTTTPLNPFVRARSRGAASAKARDNSLDERTTVKFDLNVREDVGAAITLQDSRRFGRDNNAADTLAAGSNTTDYNLGSTTNHADNDGIDVREAYIDVKKIADRNFMVRVGRQKLSLDNDRWVGTFDWNNYGRSYDGARAEYHTDDDKVVTNLFGFRIADRNNAREADDRRLWGLHNRLSYVDQVAVSPFVLISNDRRQAFQGEQDLADGPGANTNGSVLAVLYGLRLDGGWEDLDYDFEGGLQRGRFSSSPIRAYQYAWELGYTLGMMGDLKPRIGLGYAEASGDSNPNDKVRKTPEQFYPTNHSLYGIADQHGFRNLSDYSVNLKFHPCSDVTVETAFHWFRLREAEDAWYGADGNMRIAAPRTLQATAGAAGHISRQAGSEFDLIATWKINDVLTFEGGWAHYFTGAMLRDAKFALGPNAGQSHVVDLDFFYLSLTASF